MGKDLIPPPSGGAIEPVNLREALEERYLAYALSTIMNRALPDVRDGLKPVHRRILHGMRILGLNPNQAFKKSAKIVGDVMGNFHPHGDQAIYDALVRLAQDFAVRYPLIDGQGNFGNIDGDNPAAMRYTEARLTEVARLLLDGIDEDAVDFRPTYDGSDQEPVVLPGAFPNLLANGSSGIAVGMATNIPPHNAAELCNAALHLIKNPEGADRDAGRLRARSRPADRRRDGREPREHHHVLPDRPRQFPRARALGGRGPGPRHLCRGGHGNPVPGPEVEADRQHRGDGRGANACRSSRKCATNRPRTSASSSSRGRGPSTRR